MLVPTKENHGPPSPWPSPQRHSDVDGWLRRTLGRSSTRMARGRSRARHRETPVATDSAESCGQLEGCHETLDIHKKGHRRTERHCTAVLSIFDLFPATCWEREDLVIHLVISFGPHAHGHERPWLVMFRLI